MFISFEGIEGCGKTTQIDMLGKNLRARSDRIVQTREPGGSGIGKTVRNIVMSSENILLEPLAELFLILADRVQHVQEVIAPALLAGKTVLCDRFIDSTVAYQGFGRGIDLDLVLRLNQIVIDMCVPDMTILIDCPVEVGLERVRKRIPASREGELLLRFEREDRSFHRRVREGYLKIAEQEPERIVVVDGNASVDEVNERVQRAVRKAMGRKTTLRGEDS